MTEEPVATVTTQSGSDPLVITAPLNTPVSFDQLLTNSAGGASLQSQITALAARVTALENAAAESAPETA